MVKKLLVGAMWQLGWSSGEYEQMVVNAQMIVEICGPNFI